jgi:23S rRNA (pseudouridine1915-N3)-methyltransferase
MNIRILWVGKTKSQPIRSLLADYLDRIRHMVAVEIIEVRDPSKARGLKGDELVAAEERQILRSLPESGKIVVLDGTGRQFSSEDFACWFKAEQNQGTKEIVFVIGGPAGLGNGIVGLADLSLSLGKMTWTHELCRVLLLEQIYRAYCILRRIPYHR